MTRAMAMMVAALMATPAKAEFIDFAGQDGAYDRFPRSFEEDGFRISYAPTSVFGFALIDDPADHPGMCGPGCTSNGSTAFYSFNEGSVTFDLASGALFSLSSLDAAQTWLGYDRPLTLTLMGTKADGVVTETITVSPSQAATFSSFTFSKLTDLTSLTVTGGQLFPEFAIDNVNLSRTAVPEPSSWTMLVAGFGVVGWALRRRRSAARFAR